MPNIIPIRDLAKTSQISELCHSTHEPIYVTKNGYADLVVMSAVDYDAQIARFKMYEDVILGIKDVESGNVLDGNEVMARLGAKYGNQV